MPWIKFTDDFDFKPTPAATLAYKAGWMGNVTTACADQAVLAGKAERLKTPRREPTNSSNT